MTGSVTSAQGGTAGSRAPARPARIARSTLRSLLLLPLLACLLPGPAAADPDYEGPLLLGMDPVVRGTRDPRLLGVERLAALERLAAQGVRPIDGRLDRPDIMAALREHWRVKSKIDLERLERVIEYNGALGLMTAIEYPSFLYLFPAPQVLPGGFVYYPPRRLDDPSVRVFVDEPAAGAARRHAVAREVDRLENLDVAGGGRRPSDDVGLINLTIPIKLPRTLEKIIGRGEKTNIKITGRERIAITGESTVTKPFLGNERVQSQSLFPSLDMEQELQVNLSGTIGEKIILEVDHNSAAIGPESTKIKLMYQGDEDEIIRTIETGDVGLTLPGSQLLGYNSNESGLFGLKVTGQMGPADFTVVTTKQKAESTSQSFNSKGGQVTEHEILSSSYLRNRFFTLSSIAETSPIPMDAIDLFSIRIYKPVGTGTPQTGDLVNGAVYPDDTGLWDQIDFDGDAHFTSRRWVPVSLNLDVNDPNTSIMLDKENRVWALDLGTDVGDGAVLGVVFTAGNEAIRVGDDVTLPASGVVFENGQQVEGLWYRMKLLKAETSANEALSHEMMIRRIYSLGGGGITPESFNLRIERLDQTTDQPTYDESSVPYLQIFGLDNGDDYGEGQRDQRPDVFRDRLFDLRRGLLIFPPEFAEPFAGTQAQFEANALGTAFDWSASAFLQDNLTPELYAVETLPSRLSDYGKFRFVASHASASNTISLGTSSIVEGSEVVKVDGQTLTRDQDYDIDYTFGEITLKEGNFTLTAESQISVSYQFSPFVGGGDTSLLGMNLGYVLGRDSRLSTTWLYQTESIVGEKAKLGEEPSRTLVGNMNMQHTARPGFLTTVANFLSRLNTERESSVVFNGEIAAVVPDPNTKGEVYLEDFEGVDASNIVSLTRTSWTLPSFPLHGRDGTAATGVHGPEDRVPTIRWFIPPSGQSVKRRYLNPDLVNQERDETQQVMDLYIRADDGWSSENWGGIMRGVSASGLDLSQAQFVEVWVNDRVVEPTQRSGRLHIDFGLVSEDGFWPLDDEGNPRYGNRQDEDADGDLVFVQDEDTGLGGITDTQAYSAEYGSDADPFPDINSTKGNNRWDIEDPNRNGSFEQSNQYFTTIIDLADTEALVDVLEDYTDVDDLKEINQAWRKYRVPITAVFPVTDSGVPPELTRVKQVRVWFEDPGRLDNTIHMQLSELRFLGSRWDRQGIRRTVDEALLSPGDLLSGEEFFLGEVNNKENPDYRPPFAVREEQNIPEKEQALVVNFANLAQGHMLRAGKQVSSQGDDYTGYAELSWFWYNPDHTTADLDLFFRVGSDTLNFYEVGYRFADEGGKTGWHEFNVDIAELSNVKNAPEDGQGNPSGVVHDTRTGEPYRVRVVGRPDLRRIRRYYFVIANEALSAPASGYFYINDVRLLGVKRENGMAERAGVRLNMADVFKLDFDWSHRDQYYHGLNSRRGSGQDDKDWTLSTNFAINDFLPLLGFKLPVNMSRRQTIQRPRYELNSDIEIIDEDVRNSLSTIDTRESFSTRLSHPGSKSAILRYALDPWTFTLNGTRSWRSTPLDYGHQKTLQGSANYDLRLPGRYELGSLPMLGMIPLVKSVAFLPTRVAMSGSFDSRFTTRDIVDDSGNRIPQATTRNKPARLNASLDYRPLPVLDLSATGASERDLLKESMKYGINLGRENRRNYSFRMTINPPRAKSFPKGRTFAPLRAAARVVNGMRPSIRFNGSFDDDHSPAVKQPGDPDNVRNISNSGNWDFTFSLPIGDLTKKYFPERRYTEQERQRILREQQNLERRSSAEEIVLTPEETAGKTAEQIQELREQKMLEAAELRRQEEEARGGEAEPSQPPDRFSIPNPLDLILPPLRNMTPVKITLTDKRNSGFGRFTGETPFWFKTGLTSLVSESDSLYQAFSVSERQALNISGTTRIVRNMSLDLKYAQGNSSRDQSGNTTRSYQSDWPDAQVSLSGLEKWRLFGSKGEIGDGWFQSSNMSFSYRRSKVVNNITPTFYAPRTSVTWSPRWTATFHSGLTATASVNGSSEETVSAGSTQESGRLRLGLQLRHQFRAQSFLARVGLYRPGSNPLITMDVNISYDQNRQRRIDVSGLAGAATGSNRLSVNPRFSYNITRNLTGALRLIYSRLANIQTGQTTTTLGLGVEATFVF